MQIVATRASSFFSRIAQLGVAQGIASYIYVHNPRTYVCMFAVNFAAFCGVFVLSVEGGHDSE